MIDKQNHYNFYLHWCNKNTGEKYCTPFWGFRDEVHVRRTFHQWHGKPQYYVIKIERLTKNPK